jgi:biotin carboxylase
VRAAVEPGAVSGIVSTDDSTSVIASIVAEGLGLEHNPPAAVATARRKDLARAALSRAGMPSPAHRVIRLDEPLEAQIAGVGYPCVAKPLAMSASRGVIRADDPVALLAACRRIAPIAAEARDPFERRHLLVEDFISGREVALEGLLETGELRVLALFDKPDPLDGPFFEETYYVTPSRLAASVQRNVQEAVEGACRAFGLREGPVHAELRVDGARAQVLEVAARTIGGDCARLLRFGTGLGLEEIVLRHAAGLPLRTEPAAGAAGVLMIPTARAGVLRRVEGVMRARAVSGVEDVAIVKREGYELVPLPEGGDYLGFIFARAPTSVAVEAALREAHACLNVVVGSAWRLEPAARRA